MTDRRFDGNQDAPAVFECADCGHTLDHRNHDRNSASGHFFNRGEAVIRDRVDQIEVIRKAVKERGGIALRFAGVTVATPAKLVTTALSEPKKQAETVRECSECGNRLAQYAKRCRTCRAREELAKEYGKAVKSGPVGVSTPQPVREAMPRTKTPPRAGMCVDCGKRIADSSARCRPCYRSMADARRLLQPQIAIPVHEAVEATAKEAERFGPAIDAARKHHREPASILVAAILHRMPEPAAVSELAHIVQLACGGKLQLARVYGGLDTLAKDGMAVLLPTVETLKHGQRRTVQRWWRSEPVSKDGLDVRYLRVLESVDHDGKGNQILHAG